MALSILFLGKTPIQVNFFGRSFVHSRPFVRRKFFWSTRKTNLGGAHILEKNWVDGMAFVKKIVEIKTIRAIFKPFEILKFHTPLFGEFSRSSQDLGASDYSLAQIPG